MDVDEVETTQNMSVTSPPPKRFHYLPSPMRSKVRNPFEAALAERLHLPLIASPSLFQRPATPQFSSTQFEWTIDEVSSIKPAHLEPHETQFHDSPDPEYEAKAQMAISSYFKEHQIVPSPVNYSVRQQRIILAEINGNTPIGKPGRRIRDCGTQTALSLPVDLPPELEEALRPYFQAHLAASGSHSEDGKPFHHGSFDNSERSSNSSSQSGGGAHNVSMRRKLFDIHNIILWDERNRSHSPKKSQLNITSQQVQHTNPLPVPSIVGKLSDSLDKSSSDLMSPILGSECLSGSPHSPNNLHATVGSDGSCGSASKFAKMQNVASENADADVIQRRRSFLFNPSDAEELSPIYPTPRNKTKAVRQQSDDVSDEQASMQRDFVTPAKVRKASFARRRLTAASATSAVGINRDDEDDFDIESTNAKFTPDRSSSPLHSSGNNTDHATTIATESFHVRISRLAVNSAKSYRDANDVSKLGGGIGPNDDTEIGDMAVDEDDAMQVSHLSMQNSNLSSGSINSHCDTPTRKRRSASRKNLSQSFSTNWPLDDYDDGGGGNDNREEENDVGVKLPFAEKKKLQHPNEKNLVDDEGVKISIANILKAPLPEITDFITETDINTLKPTGAPPPPPPKQAQQQSVNFYRTDSGFNEMTGSLTNSNGASMLSQQDELSREALNLKTNETHDNVHAVHGYDNDYALCSTPSKPRQRSCLTAISALNHQ